MTSSNYDDLNRTLGNIEGTLQSLLKRTDRNEASSTRQLDSLQARLDTQDDAIKLLASSLNKAEDDMRWMRDQVQEMKPVTDDVKRYRAMGAGILLVVSLGAAWLGSSMGWIVGVVSAWVKSL